MMHPSQIPLPEPTDGEAAEPAPEPDYDAIIDCALAGDHLQSVDRDGYCNACGHQDTSPTVPAWVNDGAPPLGHHTPIPQPPIRFGDHPLVGFTFEVVSAVAVVWVIFNVVFPLFR